LIFNILGKSLAAHQLTHWSHSKENKMPIDPNPVTKQIVQNGCYHRRNKAFTRSVLNELRAVRASDCNSNHHRGLPFTKTELETALKATQHRKAPGPDGVPNELLTNCRETLFSWLLSFVNACLANNLIPKMWRRASVVAILKPGMPSSSPESYRPISLLCSSCKLFERLILNRINPIIDPLLPTEQAGFRKNRSTADQVCRLTQSVELAFHDRQVVGSVFLDLKAAYDTVWHKGLNLKLSKLLHCSKMTNLRNSCIADPSYYIPITDKAVVRTTSKTESPKGQY